MLMGQKNECPRIIVSHISPQAKHMPRFFFARSRCFAFSSSSRFCIWQHNYVGSRHVTRAIAGRQSPTQAQTDACTVSTDYASSMIKYTRSTYLLDGTSAEPSYSDFYRADRPECFCRAPHAFLLSVYASLVQGFSVRHGLGSRLELELGLGLGFGSNLECVKFWSCDDELEQTHLCTAVTFSNAIWPPSAKMFLFSNTLDLRICGAGHDDHHRAHITHHGGTR